MPLHLVAAIGRDFIKRSLGTTSLAEAKKRRNVADTEADALFEKAESGDHAKDAPPTVTLAELTAYVRETVERTDKAAAERAIENPPANAAELEERRLDAELTIQSLRDPSDPNAKQAAQVAAGKIAKERGLDIESPDFPTWQFFELVRRGLVEANRRRIDRLEDRHDRPFHDVLFDPQRQPPAVTFGELAGMFLAEQAEEYAASGVSQKRVDNVQSKVATLRELVGDAVPVHAIDDDIIQKVRQTLAKVPNNRTQIYPKLSLSKAIEKAEKDGRATFSAPSQTMYLDMLRRILRLGMRKKLLNGNPAEGVKPITRDKLTAAAEAPPLHGGSDQGLLRGLVLPRRRRRQVRQEGQGLEALDTVDHGVQRRAAE